MLEQFIKQQEEMTRKMDVMTTFFKFKTFVYSAVTKNKVEVNSPEFQELQNKMGDVREYMNENPTEDWGGDLILVYIAKSALFPVFPKPVASDTNYATFYNTFKLFTNNIC